MDYDKVREYIRNSSPESVIMIGCDSVRKQNRDGCTARYATVVCVRRATGAGESLMYHGSHVFGKIDVLPDYGVVERSGKIRNLRMRLMQEVTYALEVYELIVDAIGDRHFEIHLDINSRPECASNVAMQEAQGYVMGMTGGHKPEFKPFAHAATFAADALAHGLLTLH